MNMKKPCSATAAASTIERSALSPANRLRQPSCVFPAARARSTSPVFDGLSTTVRPGAVPLSFHSLYMRGRNPLNVRNVTLGSQPTASSFHGQFLLAQDHAERDRNVAVAVVGDDRADQREVGSRALDQPAHGFDAHRLLAGDLLQGLP